MGAFLDFLRRNTIQEAGTLPIVHTTQAILLKKFMATNKITPTHCDVFNCQSSYFFVGRPSYKHHVKEDNIAYWQLPVCFVFDFSALSSITRLFPFDTGAHHNKRMPEFLHIIDRDEFEVDATESNIKKIIGAFFSTPSDYFYLQPKPLKDFGSEFSLSVFDEEVRALHMLASTGGSELLDDRRFCIEVQTDTEVSLQKNKLLAVICPSIYLDDSAFRSHIENVWEAEPISYNFFPVNYDRHIGLVYDRVRSLYESLGLI